MIVDEETYLEHYGKRGMKWGVRTQSNKTSGFTKEDVRRFRKPPPGYDITRRQGNAIIRKENRSQKAREKLASKDPTFKREVKLTRKGKGISGTKLRPQVNKETELFTSKILGDFKNSKGEKVSVDFANAVLSKNQRRRDITRKAATGAIFATVILANLKIRSGR